MKRELAEQDEDAKNDEAVENDPERKKLLVGRSEA